MKASRCFLNRPIQMQQAEAVSEPFFSPSPNDAQRKNDAPFFTPSVKTPAQDTLFKKQNEQSTTNDHNLKSKRFAGETVLEQAFDNERFIVKGNSGKGIVKIQMGLMDLGFDLPLFGADGVFGSETERAIRQFQSKNGLVTDAIIGTNTMGSLDEKFQQPDVPPIPVCLETFSGKEKPFQRNLIEGEPHVSCGNDNPPTPLGGGDPIIDSVKLVKSTADGPISGYASSPCCKADENVPGPFNDIKTGAVANSHQIHFHLKSGKAEDLLVKRKLKRVAVRNKTSFDADKDDGPPADEIKRPSSDKLVVADAPGWCVGEPGSDRRLCGPPFTNDQYPITYKGDFTIFAFDPVSKKFGLMKYKVEIEKNKLDDPNPINKVEEVSKQLSP